MRAQSAPTSLAGGQLITVVNRHTETEPSPGRQVRQTERRFREFDFVGGPLRRGVAAHNGFGPARTGFMHDNCCGSKGSLNAAEGIVVKSDLCRSIRAGNHQLDGIPVPRAVGRVLMVIVGYDEPEIHVVHVIGDLHRRGLIVRSGPGATGVLFEKNVGASRARTFRDRKLGIREHGNPSPLCETAIQNDGLGCVSDRVGFLAWFDVI